MSTKINDGLRAVGTPDPFRLAQLIRSTLEPAFFSHLEQAVEQLGENAPRGPHAVARRVTELHAEREHTFHPLDLGYDIVLLPGLDWPLVLVFGEKDRPWTQTLLDAGVIESYGYWNNTDPEEGVTDAQWEHRRKDWGQALRRNPEDELFSAAPTEVGLAISSPTTFQIYQHLLAV